MNNEEKTMISARVIAGAVIAAGMIAPPGAEAAQSYPARPVRVVVAFAAGGFADTNARMITQRLSERLGQNFVVDNRGGAGGNLGAKIVVDSAKDGYTLLATTAASSVAPSLYTNIGFDLVKDLAPISNTVSAAGVFSVLASHPAKDLKDMLARTRGKRLTFGTAGVGTSSHIAADYLLRVLAKLDAVHVPFKGGAPAVAAALGGQVELLNSSGAANAHILAGRMKGLGVASLTRISILPDVPTVVEAGFPGFEERSWVGFFAPAGTPRAIVDLLNKEINVALGHPDVVAANKARGTDLHPGSAAEFTRFVHAEVAKWAKMVKQTGVKVD
jgi:tripartite-type tricarboxylate transporter receptor subunit TctC